MTVPLDPGKCGFLKKVYYHSQETTVLSQLQRCLPIASSLGPKSCNPQCPTLGWGKGHSAADLPSVQFLQHRGHIHQAELTAKVADDGSIVQHQNLPGRLGFTVLAQVDCL